MTRRLRALQNRNVGGLYKTYVPCVTAVRKPEVAGWNPSIANVLNMFRRDLSTHSHFLTTKNTVFSTKFRVSYNWDLFLENIRF